MSEVVPNYRNFFEKAKSKIIEIRKEIVAKITQEEYKSEEISVNTWRPKVSQCKSDKIIEYVNSNMFTNDLFLQMLLYYDYCSNSSGEKQCKLLLHDIISLALKIVLLNDENNKPFPKVKRMNDIEKHYLCREANDNVLKKILQTNIVCNNILTASLICVGIVNKKDTISMVTTETEKFISYGFDNNYKQPQQDLILLKPKMTMRRVKLPYYRQKNLNKSKHNPRAHALQGDIKEDDIIFEPTVQVSHIQNNNINDIVDMDIEMLSQNEMDNNVALFSSMLNQQETNEKAVTALLICKKIKNIVKCLNKNNEETNQQNLLDMFKMILESNYNILNDEYDLECLLENENKVNINEIETIIKETWCFNELDVRYNELQLKRQIKDYINVLTFEQEDYIDLFICKKFHCELRQLLKQFAILKQQHVQLHGQSSMLWNTEYIALYSLYQSTAQYVFNGKCEAFGLSQISASISSLERTFDENLNGKEEVEIYDNDIDDIDESTCVICGNLLSTDTIYVGENMQCGNCLEGAHLECHTKQMKNNSLANEQLIFCLQCQKGAMSHHWYLVLPTSLTN
eukprot:250483_1